MKAMQIILAAALALAMRPALAQPECAAAIDACAKRLPPACAERLGAGVLPAGERRACERLLRGYSECLGAVVSDCPQRAETGRDASRAAEAREAFRHAAEQRSEAAFRDVAELFADTYWGRQAAREAARLAPNDSSERAARSGGPTPVSKGAPFRDCDACPLMAPIAGGAFRMGSPESEAGRSPDETPHWREVRSFTLGVFEVTFEDWDRCVAAGGCAHRPDDRGWGRGRQPVINVSWDDAAAYARWLSAATGQAYRLPTEAEWEYAARAGTDTAFEWGARFRNGAAADGARTEPVGSYAENGFGLHDVHGNVHEWTADCWAAATGAAPRTGCAMRVMRGGAWGMAPRHLRAAARRGERAERRSADVGFRIARDD